MGQATELASLQEKNDALRDQLEKQEQKMAQLKRSFSDGPETGPQTVVKRVQQTSKPLIRQTYSDDARVIYRDEDRLSDDSVTVVDIPDSVIMIDKNAFNSWHALKRFLCPRRASWSSSG